MTFVRRRNRLTTHFSERIPVVKRRMTVYLCSPIRFNDIYWDNFTFHLLPFISLTFLYSLISLSSNAHWFDSLAELLSKPHIQRRGTLYFWIGFNFAFMKDSKSTLYCHYALEINMANSQL